MKPIQKKIFRAYDIRGVVDVDMDEEWVEQLGKAIGTFFLEKGIRQAVIGHDCRPSSPAYQHAMAKGLLSVGVDVTALNMVATPLLYFGVCHLHRTAGVMITASHNPSQYNGFKIWAGKTTIHTSEIDKIFSIMEAGKFPEGNGVGCEYFIDEDYITAVTERISLKKPCTVVLDGGNGAGGLVCAEILRRLGCTVHELYTKPDGTFPNHHPDPTVEANMADLKQAVADTGADFGMGLDGDADRLGVVDANGRMLLGDELFCLFARDALEQFGKGKILGDVKCSHRLFRDIEEHGGTPEMWTTGHSVMKARMLEVDALMAGELSGHYFFNTGWYGFDDALYAAAKLVQLLSETEIPLTALPGWEETASTPEIQVACPDEHKFAVVARAQKFFREQYTDVNEIDGVRITFPDGWGLIRASNTQPVLVLRFEATTAERLAELREIIEAPLTRWIAESGEDA